MHSQAFGPCPLELSCLTLRESPVIAWVPIDPAPGAIAVPWCRMRRFSARCNCFSGTSCPCFAALTVSLALARNLRWLRCHVGSSGAVFPAAGGSHAARSPALPIDHCPLDQFPIDALPNKCAKYVQSTKQITIQITKFKLKPMSIQRTTQTMQSQAVYVTMQIMHQWGSLKQARTG